MNFLTWHTVPRLLLLNLLFCLTAFRGEEVTSENSVWSKHREQISAGNEFQNRYMCLFHINPKDPGSSSEDGKMKRNTMLRR